MLFVEDEEVVRQLMVLTLRGQGYRVLEAAGGAEALQVAAQHPDPIHLLVADVVMPKMNGKELAERLAALRSGVKVLYVSGYAEGIIAQRGGLASLEAFLRKPFTAEELSAKVRQVLDTGAGPTPGQRRHRGKAGSPPGDPDHG